MSGPRHSGEDGGADAALAPPRYSARLLIACPDRPGIVAAVSGFLFARGANIVSSHQYSSDPSGGRFFLRTEFFLPEADDPSHDEPRTRGTASARRELERDFADEVAARLQMDWRIRWWGERQRIAILVSRRDHCLVDLLWRWRLGELVGELVSGISYHSYLDEDVRTDCGHYHTVPI